MTPEGDVVARVTDLRHRYGDTKALDGVSLDLQPGRVDGRQGTSRGGFSAMTDRNVAAASTG